MSILKDRYSKTGWELIFPLAAFLIYAYFLVRFALPTIWESIYCVYYTCLIPVFLGFTLYYRRGKETLETKLILAFWAWVYITRILNGDIFLMTDADIVINTGVMYVLLVVCLELRGRARDRFFDLAAVITVLFFTLLSIPGLYASLNHKILYNPLNGRILCSFEVYVRLMLFGKNSTIVCNWYFISFYLLVYLFFRAKNIWLRLLLTVSAIMHYLVIVMTFSRSGMLCFSLCLGLLVLALVLRRLRSGGVVKKIIIALAVLCLVVPVSYKSFSAVSGYMSRYISEAVQAQELQAEAAEEADSENSDSKALSEEEVIERLGNRAFNDSGRLRIYKTIIPTIKQEPLRVLRGCLCPDVMRVANTVLPNYQPHFHNSFLQLFSITGLPGLVLILVFCVLLAIRAVKLYLAQTPMSVKIPALMLVGIALYNMLDTDLFVCADMPSFAAYIIAGYLLSCSYEQDTKSGREMP